VQVKPKRLIPAIIELGLEGVSSARKLKTFNINYLTKLLAEGAVEMKRAFVAAPDWRSMKAPLRREDVFVQ
jgi:hypothetical protein